MDGLTLGLTIGGVIIGAAASYFFSRHFFHKSIKKKLLIPYVQFTSQLFSELDPELEENLKVNFRDLKIDNITQAQFLIANSGDIPIRDIIEPLKLKVPKENKILGFSILHTEPEGRTISYTISETDTYNEVQFHVPLLNGGDFFVFKIILQDKLPTEAFDNSQETNEQKFEFTITVDDLPPKLEIEHLPFSYYEHEKNKEFDWIGIVVSGFCLLTSILIFGTIMAFENPSLNLYIFSIKDFFNPENFSTSHVFIILTVVLGILYVLLAVLAIIATITEIVPTEKPKFRVPNKLRKEKRFHPFEYFN